MERLEIRRYERLSACLHRHLLLFDRLGCCFLLLFLRTGGLDQAFPLLKQTGQNDLRNALILHFAEHVFPRRLPGLELLGSPLDA